MSKPSDSQSEFLPTRSSLLKRLKAWDNAADWKEFFDTYQRSIHGLALKCGLNHAEAEEVVQETMVAVARQMPGFEYDRSIGSFKGWLFTITRRAIGKQIAKRARNPSNPAGAAEVPPELEAIPDPAPGFEERWEEDWRHNLMEIAVDRVRRRVSPKQFQIFDLYVHQQLPMEQVTQMLNVNAAQVYMAKLRVAAAIRSEVSLLEKRLI
jgi:RNA polymerase sigma factor (sigma-70 family)